MSAADLVPAEPLHALALARTMRAADRAEALATAGYTPLQALQESVDVSAAAWTLRIGGEVAAMCGLVPREPGVALVWLLTGEAVARHPRAFLRLCRPVMRSMLSAYPVLINAIDARYEASVRWARWLGFEVCAPEPYGIADEPFHPIVLRRQAWA